MRVVLCLCLYSIAENGVFFIKIDSPLVGSPYNEVEKEDKSLINGTINGTINSLGGGTK